MLNMRKFTPMHMAISLLVALGAGLDDWCLARGGFGGGGIRGGVDGGFRDNRGFDGAGYARDDGGSFDRGYGDYGGGMQNRAPEMQVQNYGTGTGGGARADDTGVQSWGAANRIATDGGFGRIMGTATDQGLGRNQGMGTATAQGLSRSAGMGTATAQGLGRGNFTTRMAPTDLIARADNVRQSFHHYDYFGRDWWSRHPGAWYNRYWDNYWPWGWTGWAALAGWWGIDSAAEPVYYDYGDNITYYDNNVYYGSQPECSAAEYYQQAQSQVALAPPQEAQPSTPQLQSQYAKQWKPMGVFALVQSGQGGSSSSQMMQLCVNKSGTIRGNYYNALTDQTQPIRGSVNKKSMRACWTIGNNKNVIYDTGVGNLLKNQAPVLVHYNAQSTQQFVLVRLQNPGAT